MKQRTTAYKFTIQTLDDPRLKELRETVSKANSLKHHVWSFGKHVPLQLRVCVKGRFGIMNPNLHKYRGYRLVNGIPVYGRANYRSCRLEDAKYFDVYVQERRD